MTAKSSRTLNRQGVDEIGLKSPSSIGGCIFGIGIILDSFQITGTIPDRSDGGDRFSQFVCELFNDATWYVVWIVGLGRFDGEQLLEDFVGLHR